MFNTAKAFRQSLFLTDLEYVFILIRVENDLSEEQFVARTLLLFSKQTGFFKIPFTYYYF
jgi:hypothetical protein